jgi:hypothetical protein
VTLILGTVACLVLLENLGVWAFRVWPTATEAWTNDTDSRERRANSRQDMVGIHDERTVLRDVARAVGRGIAGGMVRCLKVVVTLLNLAQTLEFDGKPVKMPTVSRVMDGRDAPLRHGSVPSQPYNTTLCGTVLGSWSRHIER